MSARNLRRVLCAAIVSLLAAVAFAAHEIGTTRVSVLFHDGRTYDIEIVTDAAALAEKLEASAGRRCQPTCARRAANVSARAVRREFPPAREARLRRRPTSTPAIAYSVTPGVDAVRHRSPPSA